MKDDNIDDRIYDLYDEYCHGKIDRRQFFERAAAVTVTGVAMATALMPNYADAQEVLFTDERIKATWLGYPSPGGTSGEMYGYLVRPTTGEGPFPAVIVMHENRGLNPYIQDVARRAAVAGFLATCFLLILLSNAVAMFPIPYINYPPTAFFSITLGLAVLGIVTVPQGPVEIAIALSIAYLGFFRDSCG